MGLWYRAKTQSRRFENSEDLWKDSGSPQGKRDALNRDGNRSNINDNSSIDRS